MLEVFKYRFPLSILIFASPALFPVSTVHDYTTPTKMHFKAITTAALAVSLVSAQSDASGKSLTDLLGSTSSLSSQAAILKAYPSIASSLASASNVTLLAPNNAAIAALQKSGALNNATTAQIEALLNYHVLDGVIPASDFTATPVFAPTALTEMAYTTVTGGQVVEAALVDGDVIITSGLKAESKVVTAVSLFRNYKLELF